MLQAIGASTTPAPVRIAPRRQTLADAHMAFVNALAATPPHRIRHIANSTDLDERAEHLGKVFAAAKAYVDAVLFDTNDNLAGAEPIDIGDLIGGLDNAACDIVFACESRATQLHGW
jgi:hypothetical protein